MAPKGLQKLRAKVSGGPYGEGPSFSNPKRAPGLRRTCMKRTYLSGIMGNQSLTCFVK